MLKTLDILIGATTVLLIFALAVTVLTQAVTNMFSRKGDHLKSGLGSLLQQLGIPEAAVADKIAGAVLQHPMLSPGKGLFGRVRLGTVIHREELTKLLLDAASGQQPALWATLDEAARASLVQMLAANGIKDPAGVLLRVRTTAMRLEASNPELANDVRQSMAILQEASSDYVARINGWFDQTIDRVSQQFARHTHVVTVGLATLVVLSVQLDMVAVVNRLSVDDSLRQQIVQSAANDTAKREGRQAAAPDATPSSAQADFNKQDYYDALGEAGLITFPFDANWGRQWSARKLPGMVIAILLVSLGAPFWYNILKDLLGLRSTLAKNDDLQRTIRQTTQEIQPAVSAVSVVSAQPDALAAPGPAALPASVVSQTPAAQPSASGSTSGASSISNGAGAAVQETVPTGG
jgi:hypothetical protein